MLDFLSDSTTELNIILGRLINIYRPGDTVDVTVEIKPAKGLKLKGAQVKLSGTVKYKYRTTSYSEDETDREVWGNAEFFTNAENFLSETSLPGGTPRRYAFQLDLPADALPSCAGTIVQIQWQCSVKLDRPMARDLHAEAELDVRAPTPGRDARPGEYGQSNEPAEANLAFILTGKEAMAGEPFSGQLHILPHKDFDSDVRLELVRTESVPRDKGNEHKATLAFELARNVHFVAGQPQTLPFQAFIPRDAASSIQTLEGSISWAMKGILSRRLRKDTSVEQAFWVYSARV